jgi:hypothetical protein
MAISPHLVVGSHRPGYCPNALDPARRSMPYLPLTSSAVAAAMAAGRQRDRFGVGSLAAAA